ncbi:DUF3327 domain-containing protein [Rhodobacteraceae bacterium B1Z28]|uniref:DUF3327 domain-containing protein n=1 Tax=Ruegeria haliotis TaxID=2747601 RepID=A0ABX2PT65_9RHOB|nr:alpha/beta hydrolase-fold protein [Ruegeria haliotis]NVO57357.1 DUF3327 domain-containing protein [Ruegeria haliotis]
MPSLVSVQPLTREKRIQTPPGTYVEGMLECAKGSVDLVLSEDGYSDRILLRDVQETHSFRFVSRAPNSILKIGQGTNSTATLNITRTVTPEQQGVAETAVVSDTPLSPRLQQITTGELTIDTFWQDVTRTGTPIVEADHEGSSDHMLLTFLWREDVRNARLIGGPAPDHVWMQRLAQTDLWFASFRVPKDLRLSYRVAPDVPNINASPRENRMALLAVAQADPNNKSPLFPSERDPFAQWSLFGEKTMQEQRQIMGQVTRNVTEHRVDDPKLASGRKIWIHVPSGFKPGATENILQIVFDGAVYLHQLDLPQCTEALVRSGDLQPVATVFVDAVSPGRRSEDLTCNDRFTRFLTNKVLPFACDRIGQEFDADRVVVSGSSFGGLAAAYAALTSSGKIGNFISLSGSFWWGPTGWTKPTPFMNTLPVDPAVRAVLTAGSYEVARHEGDLGILETTGSVTNRLNQAGAGAAMKTYCGGHDYAIWQPALTEALITLFGPANASKHAPEHAVHIRN